MRRAISLIGVHIGSHFRERTSGATCSDACKKPFGFKTLFSSQCVGVWHRDAIPHIADMDHSDKLLDVFPSVARDNMC